MKKDSVIVLGGTVPHGALIEKLKARGYYTILVDYFDDPPAASFSDIHLKDSAMDVDAVYRIAKEYDVKAVLSPCLDQQMVIAVKVMEKLGLHTPFDLDTVYKVTNKELMKQIMWDNDIPTSKYTITSGDADPDLSGFREPLIVKPADSNGAAGVSILHTTDTDAVRLAIESSKQWSRNGKVVVEEFVEGVEVSAYNFISRGKCSVLLTAQRLSSFDCGDSIKCFCSLAPARISDKAAQEIENIGNRIAEAFRLDNVPMFFQCIVSGDDVSVIEFSPRMGGGLSFRTIPEATGVDLLDASIDSWLGNEAVISANEAERYYLIHQIHGKPCVFDHLAGVDDMISDGTIMEIHLHKWKGAEISDEKSSSARVAAFITSDSDVFKLPEKAQRAVKNIRVIDVNGEDKSMDDLFLKTEMIP